MQESLVPDQLNFYDLSLKDLKSHLKSLGKEQFRAQQIFKWVYEKKVTEFEAMSNISKGFRSELPRLLHFSLPKVTSHLISQDGTQKFLFSGLANDTFEAVLIPSDDRLTLCVSSEVGCNMACKFCLTGKQKMTRKLNASEIVGQFIWAAKALAEQAKGDSSKGTQSEGNQHRISNIVFMGMGEPLDNPENVFKAIEILTSDWGINLSKKRITVSTSGIVPRMHLVADNKVRLAVSLNGVDNEIRSHLMPINKKYPLEVLLKACREHYQRSKDKITFEYVLIRGVTDSLDDAKKLHKLTRSVPCKINIIPFNEHSGSKFQSPTEEAVKAFQKELMDLGTHVLLRKSMGRDIYAACGQLRSKVENHSTS